MKREISALELWDYGHAVGLLTQKVEECVRKYAESRGNDVWYFITLDEAIKELHDLLSKDFAVPASFVRPPPPPLSLDDIPF